MGKRIEINVDDLESLTFAEAIELEEHAGCRVEALADRFKAKEWTMRDLAATTLVLGRRVDPALTWDEVEASMPAADVHIGPAAT